MVLEWLNTHLHFECVLWLFPIVFMIYDLEKMLTTEKWLKENEEKIFSISPPDYRVEPYSKLKFARKGFGTLLAITIATVLAVVFSVYSIFFLFLSFYFGQVFVDLGKSLIFKKYAPGLVTSVILLFPYSLYAYYRIIHERGFSGGDLL
jgi:hypothetical protein